MAVFASCKHQKLRLTAKARIFGPTSAPTQISRIAKFPSRQWHNPDRVLPEQAGPSAKRKHWPARQGQGRSACVGRAGRRGSCRGLGVPTIAQRKTQSGRKAPNNGRGDVCGRRSGHCERPIGRRQQRRRRRCGGGRPVTCKAVLLQCFRKGFARKPHHFPCTPGAIRRQTSIAAINHPAPRNCQSKSDDTHTQS
jgi:hypothetical protein